jgi:hypothetical protein
MAVRASAPERWALGGRSWRYRLTAGIASLAQGGRVVKPRRVKADLCASFSLHAFAAGTPLRSGTNRHARLTWTALVWLSFTSTE